MWKKDVKQLLDSTDVQDPTDFPPSSTAPGLRALDSALRCNICQELYEAPVVLTCGHCFCSLCARSQLSEKPTCPTCWKEATISSFRVNPAMEEAVTAWKDARRFVLCMVNEALKVSESSRPSKRHKPNSHSANAVSSRSDDEIDQDSEPLASNSNIECPVCTKGIPMANINDHLDSNCKRYLSSNKTVCSSKSGGKDAWSKLFDGTKKGGKETELDTPLPKASYTILKDKQIRDLLATQELSTTGDRTQLIARHERWVTVYNANLDRSPALRRRPAELRVEMRRWEEDRRGSRKVPLKTDITEYRRANKAEFDKLVQLARPKSNRHSESARGEGDNRGDSAVGPAMESGGEIEAIIVDSDSEGR